MLTQKRLQELLLYYPETGKFYWRLSQGSKKAYTEAGCENRGYVMIKIDRIKYAAHRLAFLYIEGVFPEHDVDHKFGIKNDNRWSELRKATRSQNAANSGKRPANILGVKNVTQLKDTKKYQVIVQNKSYGCYADLELADLVATEVRNKVFGAYARHV